MWEEEKITHLHIWEELPNSEKVAKDIHVDLKDYFAFELLYFCTFVLLYFYTFVLLYFCTTFGRGDWIEGMGHILGGFKKTDDSPFFPNWSSRSHKNPEQINQIAFKILET